MISLSSSEFTSECKYKFVFKKLQILQNFWKNEIHFKKMSLVNWIEYSKRTF